MPNCAKFLLGFALLGLLSACPRQQQAEPAAWAWPEQMPTGAAAEAVRYGETLLNQTHTHLGPQAAKPELRLAGNRLNCSNCHHQAGKQQNAMGFVGIAGRYPAYYAPLDREVTLAERVNACFERSLNARAPLPEAGAEMQGILAYMRWLSEKVPAGQTAPGSGLPESKLLDRPADPVQGKSLYSYHCAACHAPDGKGVLRDVAQPKAGYTFPPVAGPDSYSTGSNLARLSVLARYIQANMPLGRAVLNNEDATDIAAFILQLERPAYAGAGKDYPNPATRPADVPYGPYPDASKAPQHQLGPYTPDLSGLR